MSTSSATTDRTLEELAARHEFSAGAVRHMLEAVSRGHGDMAQFSHPEFSGSGQWMRGGMVMISSMFDDELKGRVDRLCNDLGDLVKRQQAEGGSSQQPASSGPGQRGWWPEKLGQPASQGGQNEVHYAYFPQAQRLAVKRSGQVTVYDTQDHQISGFSQQQGGRDSLSFSSQHGSIDLGRLRVVSH